MCEWNKATSYLKVRWGMLLSINFVIEYYSCVHSGGFVLRNYKFTCKQATLEPSFIKKVLERNNKAIKAVVTGSYTVKIERSF